MRSAGAASSNPSNAPSSTGMWPPSSPAAAGHTPRSTDPILFWAMRMLRRLLWRRATAPSVAKMMGMLIGLWLASRWRSGWPGWLA